MLQHKSHARHTIRSNVFPEKIDDNFRLSNIQPDFKKEYSINWRGTMHSNPIVLKPIILEIPVNCFEEGELYGRIPFDDEFEL